ncbi:hypothetical protein M9Y10_016572 [Tritrichomonas musculus]|uniref:Uncharacterized protein n=1 Tax=Tritrichomonas musculus TaxID=1915356 RepID=A0ABR2HY48_9EUKA
MFITDYHLSLYFHSIDIDKSIIPKSSMDDGNQVWCMLSIGSDPPVSTSAAPLSPHSELDYSLDVEFRPTTSGPCYLYLTICSFDSDSIYSNSPDLVALARAKVSIEKLPLNGPNAFRIPFMVKNEKKNSKNKKKGNFESELRQVATILISGIIDPPLEKEVTD